MTITIEATYENGVLKPLQPLKLVEHERVEITIQTIAAAADKHADLPSTGTSRQETAAPNGYGLVGWTGGSEAIQRVALDPEFGIHESP